MRPHLPSRCPAIIAHRGASHDAPENTLAAFSRAWQQGADGIEGDFRLSADGGILCIHDATTERTAGVDVSVEKTTSDHLRGLDVGKWKGEKWTGEHIPLIEEVFSTIPEGKQIFIEIKCGNEIIPPLREAIRKSGLKPEQPVVISFNEDVIAEAKNRMPHLKVLWLTVIEKSSKGIWTPSPEQMLTVMKKTHADGISVSASSVIEKGIVRKLRDNNKEFHVWNVNNIQNAKQFIDLGVDSITTDRPGWLREKLTRL